MHLCVRVTRSRYNSYNIYIIYDNACSLWYAKQRGSVVINIHNFTYKAYIPPDRVLS